MGPLGWQETVFIFILALLLFGPKKLPELGRTMGKAITEFRRASNELKATFDREMKTLEQESDSLKQITSQYSPETYNYDYSSYDYGTDYSSTYGSESDESTAANTSTESASATQGAESDSAATPEGTVAHGDGDGSRDERFHHAFRRGRGSGAGGSGRTGACRIDG